MSYEQLATSVDALAEVNKVLVSAAMEAREASQANVTLTEAARDAAQLSAGIFETTTLGLAATTAGKYFSTPSIITDQALILYQNKLGVAVPITTYPSGKAITDLRNDTKNAVATAALRNFSKLYPWAITDEDMNIILAITAKGKIEGLFDKLPGLKLLGDYAWVICDSNETVLFGIKWSGEVVTYPSPLATTAGGFAWTEGPTGQRDIYVLINGVPYQLTSAGDNSSPRYQSGSVSYVERNGGVTPREVPLPEAGSIANFVNAIIHIIFLGQSLACGINSGTPVTLQPPSANRILTIQDGIQLSDETGILPPTAIVPFKAMQAKTKEPPCMQMAFEINRKRGLPANAGLLISNHARGAQGINTLKKGTIPYQNSLTAIIEAKKECDSKGWPYSVPCISWNQGQHDGGMAAGIYYALLVQLQLDYEADIQAITGQLGRIPMVITQMSNWTAPVYNRAFSNIPHEQYQVSLDFPDRFVISGPQYWLPTNTDGIHMPANSYARDGVALAGAVGAMIKGETWKPTACVEAVRSGTKVTLRFDVPEGPLAIDTVNVTDPGNWGLRWVDSTNSASIASVKLTGFNTIEVTLNKLPTGASPKIGVADIGVAGQRGGPTTGPRTCIRDSCTRLDHAALPVYNWACHNLVAVTSI